MFDRLFACLLAVAADVAVDVVAVVAGVVAVDIADRSLHLVSVSQAGKNSQGLPKGALCRLLSRRRGRNFNPGRLYISVERQTIKH